jgi:pimeloyl-ACP methyl ester carboxylesterase
MFRPSSAARGTTRAEALARLIGAATLAGCTAVSGPPGDAVRPPAPAPALAYERLDPAAVRVEAQERTVEDHFLLDIYGWLHHERYISYRVEFPDGDGDGDGDGEGGVAHWLVPDGDGPHPSVMVFPILAGTHVVSEGLAKALVNRGFAVLRMEREPLDLEQADDPAAPARAFRKALADARRLLDWLVTRPETDTEHVAAAGISLGGILAATLVGQDPRVDAGFFVMAGGGLGELLYDSGEKPVRAFRDRVLEQRGLQTREEFVALLRPHVTDVDPLRWAAHVDPRRVLLVSGRFDRVVPRERTEALWEALGRPRWVRFPAGHYQLFPFFWWAAGRGADHLQQVFGIELPPACPTRSVTGITSRSAATSDRLVRGRTAAPPAHFSGRVRRPMRSREAR